MYRQNCKPVSLSLDEETVRLLDDVQRRLNNTQFSTAPLNRSAFYRHCLNLGMCAALEQCEQWRKLNEV